MCVRAGQLTCLGITSASACLLAWLLGEQPDSDVILPCVCVRPHGFEGTTFCRTLYHLRAQPFVALSITPQQLQASFEALATDGKISAAALVTVQCFEWIGLRLCFLSAGFFESLANQRISYYTQHFRNLVWTKN